MADDEATAGEGLDARIKAFRAAWLQAQGSGDEAAVDALRQEGIAIAAVWQSRNPSAAAADTATVEQRAALDAALTAAVQGANDDARDTGWRKVPVPDGFADAAPIPPDVQAAIRKLADRWPEADEAGRKGLVTEAAAIAASLRGDGAPGAGDGSDVRAAVEAAVAGGARRADWEAIPVAPREAVPADKIEGGFPDPILGVAGIVPGSEGSDGKGGKEWGGAVVSVGTVAVLSGEGSVAKSGLTCDLAVGIAEQLNGFRNKEKRTLHDLPGGLFKAQGGPVLMVTYEDPPSVTGLKLQQAAKDRKLKESALQRVHVLDMEGEALFGPPAPKPDRNDDGVIIGEEKAGLYNQRPEPLPGWWVMWGEVARIRPVLVVIDPALAAYVGDAIGVAPVREFLTALIGKAREFGCGVLVVAHSTKAARGGTGKADPLDPGHVSGSAAWFDGSRGVMVMQFADGYPPDDGIRTLALPKVNYGHGRIGCVIKPVRKGSGAIVGFDVMEPWKHLTDTKHGEQEGKGEDADKPKAKDRPYHHAGAVIDAVRVLTGDRVSEAKESAVQEPAWEEARKIVNEFPESKAVGEARKRYGQAKRSELAGPDAKQYAAASGGTPNGRKRGGNGAAGRGVDPNKGKRGV